MTKMFAQYLAINNNANWPKSTLNLQSRFKSLPNTNKTLKKLPNILKFCQSGEILPNMVILPVEHILKGINKLHSRGGKQMLVFLVFSFNV